MKLVIATGIFPPDLGGPAQYAKNLYEEFKKAGYKTSLVSYGPLERRLPPGLRHVLYGARLFSKSWEADIILALDTLSVGWPAAMVAKISGAKLVIRIGGDFLWESYVERTGDLIPLSKFYVAAPRLSFKEKIIFSLTRWLVGRAQGLAFTTKWQWQIWQKPYHLSRAAKIIVIENYIGQKKVGIEPKEKVFLVAGRVLKLKNRERLRRVFAEVQKQNPDISLEEVSGLARQDLERKIASSYAVLIPSVSEVSPNLVWEAMQYNKPFIVTRDCGYREQLKDCALFIDPLDKKDIKEKILLLVRPEVYKEKQERIAGWREARPWSLLAQEFLNLFSQV